jgi:hypothetical protein
MDEKKPWQVVIMVTGIGLPSWLPVFRFEETYFVFILFALLVSFTIPFVIVSLIPIDTFNELCSWGFPSSLKIGVFKLILLPLSIIFTILCWVIPLLFIYFNLLN